MKMFIFYSFIIYGIYNLYAYFTINSYLSLSFHINIYSCNRLIYLNKTLKSLLNHITANNKKNKYNIIWYDQGTMDRYSILDLHQLHNMFFMNPLGYSYSFGLSFSYTPTSYVLILEEDWVIDETNNLKYKDFITISIILLNFNQNISGIILRSFPYSVLKTQKINLKYSQIELFILHKPYNNFAYINGPTIYRSKILSMLPFYKDELSTGHWFYNHGFRLGIFNNSGKLKDGRKINEHIFLHLGYNTTRKGMCNTFLY